MGNLFYFLSVGSPLLPIAFFFIFLNRNRQSRLWVIAVYAGCSLIADLFFLSLHGQQKNNGILFYQSTIFTFIEGTAFGYFLYPFLKSVFNKNAILFLFILQIFIGIATSIYHLPDSSENPFFVVSEELFVIILCIFYFYEQVNNPEVTFLYATKEFWIIISFFFYTTSTLFLFLSTNDLAQKDKEAFWVISQAGNIIKNLLFIIAFVKFPTGQPLGRLERKP